MPEYYNLSLGKEDINAALLRAMNTPRVNLFDNPNFSINQRGKTNYSGGYCADRWVSTLASVVGDGSITPTAKSWTYQRIPGKTLTGKTLTLSVLFEDGELMSGTNVVSGTHTTFFNLDGFEGYVESKDENDFQPGVIYEPESRPIVYCKLEEGEGQTAAHKENGVWVINDQKDPVLDLLRCQRYYVPVGGSLGLVIGGAHFGNLQIAAVDIPVPVTMRANPVITDIVNLGTLFYGNSTKSVERLTVDQVHAGSVRVFYGQTGITENCPCAFDSMKFAFSSDL